MEVLNEEYGYFELDISLPVRIETLNIGCLDGKSMELYVTRRDIVDEK